MQSSDTSARSSARTTSESEGLWDTSESDDWYSQQPSSHASDVIPYEEERFRCIRDCFGINSKEYADKFPINQTAESILKESVSEGASGSFFYRITGSNYIIKQVEKSEVDALVDSLEDYEAHVMDSMQMGRGGTLIHYYGAFAVQLSWWGSGKVYFVVMRNIFPRVRPSMVFDLKGATANRRGLSEDDLHGDHVMFHDDVMDLHQSGRHTQGGISKYIPALRDWEWMDTAMHLNMSDEDISRVMAMVANDITFLRQMGFIDYSLLIGIKRLQGTTPAERMTESAEILEDCTMGHGRFSFAWRSEDRQKVYMMGVIDVLNPYTFGWKAQRAALMGMYCLSGNVARSWGISAIPPHLYAARLRAFCRREVFNRKFVPEEETDDELKWTSLWLRKRRGLVRARIQMELQDSRQRHAELIGEKEELERRLKPHEHNMHSVTLKQRSSSSISLASGLSRNNRKSPYSQSFSYVPPTAPSSGGSPQSFASSTDSNPALSLPSIDESTHQVSPRESTPKQAAPFLPNDAPRLSQLDFAQEGSMAQHDCLTEEDLNSVTSQASENKSPRFSGDLNSPEL
eukprot:TRINITY_DN2144_c0_g1_i5.p1 TRINITY_DN2144_c0_g1~~TRINITY_DN2144_c0_g1_i5.p1  ORF type:complete len:572 (+),score=109.35 TRINITY_DN2144_c0_g1_i5:1628-3343(+)